MFNFFRKRPSDEDLSGTLLEAIPEHLSRYLPGEPTVWHEILPNGLRIDVYCWAPTPERPLWTLVTCGMSLHQMNVPRSLKNLDRAELMITLPADWTPLIQSRDVPDEEEQRNNWPFQQLKFTAVVPYLMDTWLGYGSTLQAGETIDETYEGSEFSGLILGGPTSVEDTGIFELEVGGVTVQFWGLYFLYPQETAFHLEHSPEELLERLDAAGIHEGVFPHRPSVVSPQG